MANDRSGSISDTRVQRVFELTRTPAQIAALQDICHAWQHGPEDFWSFDSVLDAMSRPGSVVLFTASDREALSWSGALLLDVGPYSADLLYVYTHPNFRRQNLARRLLEYAFGILANKSQMEALFLEVRVSNIGAQKLYQSLGMSLVGTRKRYYANGEDALIYKIEFGGTDRSTAGAGD